MSETHEHPALHSGIGELERRLDRVSDRIDTLEALPQRLRDVTARFENHQANACGDEHHASPADLDALTGRIDALIERVEDLEHKLTDHDRRIGQGFMEALAAQRIPVRPKDAYVAPLYSKRHAIRAALTVATRSEYVPEAIAFDQELWKAGWRIVRREA